jgi:homoserine O-acetyltransferase/O-succinyltransferase
MPHPPLRPGMIDAPHQRAMLGDFRLESGELIRDFEVSYVTHGTLNAARDNAILVTASLTGNHHRLDFLIGPARALDTERYFIVCVDPIGNGLTTSPSNSASQPGMAFPRFTLRDMVESQFGLLREEMGLNILHAVVGASMGGMQALQWGVSYNNFMRALVAMTPMARTAPWAIAVVETARRALMADPAWDGNGFGAYPARGWSAWTGVMSVLAGRTPQALDDTFESPLDVLPWMDKLTADNRANGFDATDWLYQSWAYQAHDVGTSPGFDGDTSAALASIRARTLILAPPLDMFNPVQCAHHAADAIPGATLIEIPSCQGHQAASSLQAEDAVFLNEEVAAFLAAVPVGEGG